MEINQQYLQECFSYNPVTGVLRWRERPVRHFNSEHRAKIFNAKFSGSEAGAIMRDNSYYRVGLIGNKYLAHRLIWMLKNNEWPDQIDHINGNGLDNRFNNLRNVDNQTNLLNKKVYSNSMSGISGVRWSKSRKKFQVYIGITGNFTHLGYFKDKFEAVCCRKSAEIKAHFHQNHSRR